MAIHQEDETGTSEPNLAEILSQERYLARMAAELPIHKNYGKYLSEAGASQELIDQALIAWQSGMREEQERVDREDPISQLQHILGRAMQGESAEGRRILEASILDLEKTRAHIVDVHEGRVNPAGNVESREEASSNTYHIPTFVILSGAYSSRNSGHVNLNNKLLTLLEVLKPGETGQSLGQQARTFIDDSLKDSPEKAQILLPGQSIKGPIFPRTETSINVSGLAVGPFPTNISNLEVRLTQSPMLRVVINQRNFANIQPPIRK